MAEPRVLHVPGAYGALILAACPFCDWRGRKRDPNNVHATPSEVRAVCWGESRRHIEAKHGVPVASVHERGSAGVDGA